MKIKQKWHQHLTIHTTSNHKNDDDDDDNAVNGNDQAVTSATSQVLSRAKSGF